VRKTFLPFLIGFFIAACGLLQASQADSPSAIPAPSEWTFSQKFSVAIFRLKEEPAKQTGVYLAWERSGKIGIVFHFPGREMRFREREIRVVETANGREHSFAIYGVRSKIDLPQLDDFILEMPPLWLDGSLTLGFKAHFRWAKSGYIVEQL
jgi:hypothetical protein